MIFTVSTTTKTLQLRLKDKHARVLRQMACEVNQVWNHINAISAKAARPFHGKPRFLSGYDLQKFTAGFSQCEGVSVGSGTVQVVCTEYATRRKQFKKTRLNWRVSNPQSAKYSLGWFRSRVATPNTKPGKSILQARSSASGTATAWPTTNCARAASAKTAEGAGISMW